MNEKQVYEDVDKTEILSFLIIVWLEAQRDHNITLPKVAMSRAVFY